MIQQVTIGSLPLILGALSSASNTQAVYRDVKKPDWTPKPVYFPIVWTALYIMMGVGSVIVSNRTGVFSAPMMLYWMQLALNVAWSPIFFSMQKYDAALFLIRALILAVTVTIVSWWTVSKTAALLLLPYLAWLFVAHALNAYIVRENCC